VAATKRRQNARGTRRQPACEFVRQQCRSSQPAFHIPLTRPLAKPRIPRGVFRGRLHDSDAPYRVKHSTLGPVVASHDFSRQFVSRSPSSFDIPCSIFCGSPGRSQQKNRGLETTNPRRRLSIQFFELLFASIIGADLDDRARQVAARFLPSLTD
jgi:hypothetical protein